MRKTSFIFYLLLLHVLFRAGSPVFAQQRGYQETFTGTNAGWLIFVEGEEDLFPAEQDAIVTNFIYSFVFTNRATQLFADSFSSDGKLTGNLLDAKAAGFQADAFADIAGEIETVDIYFYSAFDGKEYRFGNWDFLSATNWQTLTAPFFNTNWLADGISGLIPTQALAQVSEVGIAITPVATNTLETYVNLDNFILIPELIEPVFSPDDPAGVTNGAPYINIDAQQGQAYTVKWTTNLLTASNLWAELPGYIDVPGAGSNLNVVVTNEHPSSFFSVETRIRYSSE